MLHDILPGQDGVAGVNLPAHWLPLKPLLAARSLASTPLLPSTEPLPRSHAEVPPPPGPAPQMEHGSRWNGDREQQAGLEEELVPPHLSLLSPQPPRTCCCGIISAVGTNGPDFSLSLNPCPGPCDFVVALTMEIESIPSSLDCMDSD